METYRVIGIMSGTSLDGIDIALCDFVQKNNIWSFNIVESQTLKYKSETENKLRFSKELSGFDLMMLHNELGDLIGESINNFIIEKKIDKSSINFISSHGHTVFHQPDKRITTQIGNGANISSVTKLPVICDFRTVDVSLNGNGAPLVPIGDKLLFSDYDYYLNLGGIANISFENNQEMLAFDICPVNIVLNKLVNTINLEFDNEGQLARNGKINLNLLNELNNLDYYQIPNPKSLGIEWIESKIFPLLSNYNLSLADKLNTFIEHIAIQISKLINECSKTVLVTGGGSYNKYLIERIQHFSSSKLIVPDKTIIEFKEALIFAFLGVLRYRNEVNCLSSVTGATENNIGGCIYNAF
ncbi:MAG: Anhydro-N-acetylmuramic acid kinase [Flavobacteriales bacterium]|nr:Anhydro-N-acetylmuramic acid kinase [Flavobacteriales bacterium]